jgi:DNA ligase-associated metallophosphoesterase
MPFSPKLPVPLSTRPWGLSKEHRITLNGLDFIPDLSGALFVPEFKTLLIADLHLEKASNMAKRGVHLPPYDTRASLAQLQAVIAQAQPEQLIFLGDSFHDDEARDRIAETDLASLRALSMGVATIWITGNHDPHPPTDVGGRIANEVVLGGVTLRHEPKKLEPEEFEIAGHLHPGSAVSQRGKSIHCKCFIADGRRLVMPAFGSFTGGLSISSPSFKNLFLEKNFHVWMLSQRAIYKFPAKRVR